MELFIPPQHRPDFLPLSFLFTSSDTRFGPVTYTGHLRVITTDLNLADVLTRNYGASPLE